MCIHNLQNVTEGLYLDYAKHTNLNINSIQPIETSSEKNRL